MIITISRETGSGGHTIGELLANKLGYTFYDREIVNEIASEMNIDESVVDDNSEELAARGFRRRRADIPVEEIKKMQEKIIKEIAAKGNCVIVGRGADEILKGYKDAFHVFIHADLDERVERMARHRGQENNKDAIRRELIERDRSRAKNYELYAGREWGKIENYNFGVNSSKLTKNQCVDYIIKAIDKVHGPMESVGPEARKEILAACDHMLLGKSITERELVAFMDDAVKYKTYSVCIPPCYVKKAKDYLAGKMKVCTVIGFPNGYQTTTVKAFETKEALENGADEIDMVMNICEFKSGNYTYVKDEIAEIKKICGDKVLKVIIETALLDRNEKIKACEIIAEAGADYVKTSTGCLPQGATFEDIELLRDNAPASLKIKAAGGISSFREANKMIKLGADRLGTSRLVKIAKQEDNRLLAAKEVN